MLGHGRVAQRNSPVSRSSVYTTPVLPGMAVTTLRVSSAASPGLIQLTAAGSGGHRGVDEDALVGVIEVSVVVQVLTI